MSKKSRARSKDRRASMRRARKAASQLQYATWAAQGTNQKSKRSKLNKLRRRFIRTKRHGVGRCDNHGCPKCFPMHNTPEYALPGSYLYEKRWRR